MNLSHLFETQKQLDEHIENEHPRQDGEDRLSKKILALQVELGELANEWRGFKYWSQNQAPRTKKSRRPYMDLEDAEFYNPFLEEYVDCLHFILSIGLELGINEIYTDVQPFVDERLDNVTIMFHQIFASLSNLFWMYHYEQSKSDGSKHFEYLELSQCFLQLGEMLRFSWNEIETAYFEKNAVNHKRQETGY